MGARGHAAEDRAYMTVIRSNANLGPKPPEPARCHDRRNAGPPQREAGNATSNQNQSTPPARQQLGSREEDCFAAAAQHRASIRAGADDAAGQQRPGLVRMADGAMTAEAVAGRRGGARCARSDSPSSRVTDNM